MKTYYLLLLFLLSHMLLAQKQKSEVNEIAESEMKAASSVLNFVVNPNTLNYDVTYQKLELTVDPSVYYITGKVTATFTALSPMSTITFDLTNQLDVSSVTKDNLSLSFIQNNSNEVVITFQNVIPAGTSATVVIDYAGEPASGESAFETNSHNGTPVLWTLSQPYGSQDWWPCKQDLNDKIDSIDVYITAPSQYVSVSNGLEVDAVINLNGSKTTHFHHGYPIPAYLVAIAVTNYSIFTQQAGTAPNAFPIVNYIYPENLSSAQNSLSVTLPIMNFFEQILEPYPYSDEKYGHAQFGWSGGMEHTTVSFMGGFSRGLIAHELAHQWFGDKITCGTWKDIWLNEGFATYLASLVIQHLDGNTAFINDKDSKINFITSQTGGALYLTESETNSVSRIFSSRLSYNKGAMVLNMLRFKMGDTAFFQGLQNYLADPNLAFKYAVTSDLQSHLEAVYGQSLTGFFNDWVYKQGYPSYAITVQNLAAGQVAFFINQTQSHSSVDFFEMPVPIRVFGAGGEQLDLVLNNTTNNQTIVQNVPFAVTAVLFDPNKELISNGNTIALGLQNIELNSVVLYPNPASKELTLKIPTNVEIKKTDFYNALGQKINTTTTATNWDISALSEGVYFMEVMTNFGKKQIQFVKK